MSVSRRTAALLLAVAVVASGCWPWDDAEVPLSEMELKRQAGTVVVQRAGERIDVADRVVLHPGDIIETFDESAARLRLAGDRLAEMASNGRVRVVSSRSLESLSGSLLSDAEQDLTVRFESVNVTSDSGLFRVDRGVATARAGVYRGTVTVESAGEIALTVDRLYEVSVTANDVPAAARPYRLAASDAWDERYLAPVLRLEDELQRLATALLNQIGRRRPGLSYFKTLAHGRDVRFIRPYLDEPVDNLLVGFVVALHAEGQFGDAFRRAFGLHEQGASWGVVSALMDVRGRVVLADLQDIILATGAVGEGAGVAGFSQAAAQAAGVGGPGPGRADPDPAGPPGDDDPPKEPRPSPEPTCDPDDVQCQVEEALPTPVATPTSHP